MGLTKPRAAQIFNLDYKQSTRVVTTINITLTGGAPSLVDGVSLSTGDRILVIAQTTGTQNGLYYVTTLGSGSNGTWARTSDGNENGEIEAGMIVMVTEGIIYADTQWKLITDDPIIINTTALTFTQNYMANSISGGTSNVVVNSNANVTISSAGTANVLLISSTGTVTSGTASVTGNITIGNVLTGGLVSATGNITGSYIFGNGSQLTGLPATYGNTNVAAFLAVYGSNTISSTGTITAGNITGGNILTGGAVSATGNVTGNYILGNGASLTGVITSVANINNGTSNVTVVSSGGNVTVGVGGTGNIAVFATTGEYVSGLLSVTGNITGGNISATNHTGTNVSVTGTQTAASTVGGVITGSSVSVTGTTTAASVVGGVMTGSSLSASGNVTGGNIRTIGQASATGNVTTDTFFVGNGYFLTGISSAISVTKIENGNSNVWVNTAGGDVTVTAGGVANVAVFSTGSLTLQGAFGTPKTITSNIIVAAGINAMLIGPLVFGDGYNLTVPNSSTVYVYAP